MNWLSMDQFLQMGGYGRYVWGAYGLTLVLMVAEALLAHRRQRAALHAARTDDNSEAAA